MADRWEPAAAATVIALVTFSLWQAWQGVAPGLSELRETSKGGTDWAAAHTKLKDADLTVGSLALIVGTSMAVMTKNFTVILILICSFGALSLWYHSVLNAPTPNGARYMT